MSFPVPCSLFSVLPPPSPLCITFQFPAVPLSSPLTSILSAISVESIAVWTAAVPLSVLRKRKKQNNLDRIHLIYNFETNEIRSYNLYERKVKFSKWLRIILEFLLDAAPFAFLSKFG